MNPDARVTIHPYRLPFTRPWVTAKRAAQEREGWLVQASREGHTGWGDAAPLPVASVRALDACGDALRAAAARGADAARAELAEDPFARHGVTLALADLGARERGVPLARHLAGDGAVRGEVPVNAVIASTDDVAAEAREHAKEGYRVMKVKASASVEETATRVRAVRDAVGRHVELRVDANGAWSRTAARRALELLEPLEVAFVEQPLAARDVDGMRALVTEGRVRVAADEAVTGPREAERILQAGAAEVLVVKPQRVGGPERALAVARVAAEHDVPVVVTTSLDTAVGRAGALAVAAAAPGEILACGLATARVLDRDVGPLEHVERGAMRVPDAPGIGFEPEVPSVG